MTRRLILALIVALFLSLLVQWVIIAAGRTYHPVALKDIPTTRHTHACTVGTVTLVKKEADGDVHIRLEDAGAFIVLETIPGLPLARPKKGQRITACGITRQDKEHGHFELHPLEKWTLVKGQP